MGIVAFEELGQGVDADEKGNANNDDNGDNNKEFGEGEAFGLFNDHFSIIYSLLFNFIVLANRHPIFVKVIKIKKKRRWRSLGDEWWLWHTSRSKCCLSHRYGHLVLNSRRNDREV